ncbi:MAG TPA: YSC84-related protein [Candidatus Didemnitutus sp.]|nr:YSC84-related protein [Candidatus Didemnitutus sp.]
MKNRFRIVAVVLATVAAAVGLFAKSNSIDNLKAASAAIEDEKDRLEFQTALVSFKESKKVDVFFEKSFAVVLFPTVGKGGLGIGGAHGSGWAFREGKLVGEIKMTQVTFGFQAGGQAFSQVIFFEDERAFRQFSSGNFELGAQASAVAITAGANAGASTAGGASAGAGDEQAKTKYTDGMAIFTLAKGGLMYEASVGGQKFKYKSLEK